MESKAARMVGEENKTVLAFFLRQCLFFLLTCGVLHLDG